MTGANVGGSNKPCQYSRGEVWENTVGMSQYKTIPVKIIQGWTTEWLLCHDCGCGFSLSVWFTVDRDTNKKTVSKPLLPLCQTCFDTMAMETAMNTSLRIN
jgi:hypothetical protein